MFRFKTRSDWINSNKSGKFSAYWNGSYYCKLDQCKCTFGAVLQNNVNRGESANLNVTVYGNCNHDKVSFIKRCDKKTREKLAPKIVADGIDSVFRENFFENLRNQFDPGT